MRPGGFFATPGGRLRRLALRAGLSVARRASGRVWSSLEPAEGWDAKPRHGWGRPSHPRLGLLLGEREADYRWIFDALRRYGQGLAAIPRSSADPIDPIWSYGDFPGLDIASLYCLIRDHRPRRYVEIGSGNSTRVAARAARDAKDPLEITSIDPEPRLAIDALCDRVVRRRLEDADLGLFTDLEPGDLLFLDGSHRVLPGNDVTTFFLDVLPELPAGVVVGVHDVYLPDDYPEVYGREYFSEQYLLAAHLLARNGEVDIVLPCHYLCVTEELATELHAAWEKIGLGGVPEYGNAFWWRTG